jgi:hypothetical protein
MVPISNGRIQIFENQLLNLIDYFLKQRFTKER